MAKKERTRKPAADAAAEGDEQLTQAGPVDVEPLPDTNGIKSDEAINLLLDACEVYGINPDPETRPKELLQWRYYPADRREDRPARVVIVTAGGQKVDLFEGDADPMMTIDSEEVLRGIFNAYKIDPVSKLRVNSDLPEDLTLPRIAVTGVPEGVAHRYVGGYLRRGEKK